MTFKELFQDGQCSINAIDTWAEIWHRRNNIAQNLQDFLGLSDTEYQAWLVQGSAGLAHELHEERTPEYEAVYLDWDELTTRLQMIVDEKLGPGYTVKLRREDCYYWAMKLECSQTLDKKHCKQICERLELENVETEEYRSDNWLDSGSLANLLSKLTNREISSSHADDYGVWIICKSLIWSTPEFTQRLLTQCERRLRQEIGDRHYSMVNEDRACHQLFGFKEALVMLGLLTQDQLVVMPNHFSGTNAAQKNV